MLNMRPLDALSFLTLRRIPLVYLFHLSYLEDSGNKIGNFGWNILS